MTTHPDNFKTAFRLYFCDYRNYLRRADIEPDNQILIVIDSIHRALRVLNLMRFLPNLQVPATASIIAQRIRWDNVSPHNSIADSVARYYGHIPPHTAPAALPSVPVRVPIWF